MLIFCRPKRRKHAEDLFLNSSTTALTPGPVFSGNNWDKEITHSVAGLYDRVEVKEAGVLIEDGVQYTPPATENLSTAYDADGNLLQDGRWTYVWDGENRLLSMESAPQTTNPAVAGRKLSFKYDGLSRRIGKIVETRPNTSAAYALVKHEGYVYDGWNLVMTVKFTTTSPTAPARVASYVWGPDIGSTPYARKSWQKAGGVGGLLCVVGILSDNSDTYFPLSDRMGNITGYRRPATATSTVLNNDLANTGAIYDYDAFGKEFRSSGPAADTVPFHFSTKFTDAETGLNYYGYRYFDPVNGRWLGRDPIGETGGVNLYGMVGNNPVIAVDILGENTVRSCKSTIRAGHGSNDHPSTVESNPPAHQIGDRCTAVSCFNGNINDRFDKSGLGPVRYDGERFEDPKIPTFNRDPQFPDQIDRKNPLNPNQPGLLPDAGPNNAYDSLEASIKAAKAKAVEDCKGECWDSKDGTKCRDIEIRVECVGDIFAKIAQKLKKPSLCGKTWKYNCASKQWSPKD